MSPTDNKWRPSVEGLFYDDEGDLLDGSYPVKHSIEAITSALADPDFGQRPYNSEIEAYMEESSEGAVEFLVHPNHMHTAFHDYRKFFEDMELDSWIWDEEVYLESLIQTVKKAEKEGRPVFALYSERGMDYDKTAEFVEDKLGLHEKSYRLIPTIKFNGAVETGNGLEEMAAILQERSNMQARVSGQEHGNCTLQYETMLEAVSEISETVNIDVKTGPKFPLLPFAREKEIAETSNVRTRKARETYEKFLEREF